MSLSEILFIMWINTTPLSIIGLGCYFFYLLVIHEARKHGD